MPRSGLALCELGARRCTHPNTHTWWHTECKWRVVGREALTVPHGPDDRSFPESSPRTPRNELLVLRKFGVPQRARATRTPFDPSAHLPVSMRVIDRGIPMYPAKLRRARLFHDSISCVCSWLPSLPRGSGSWSEHVWPPKTNKYSDRHMGRRTHLAMSLRAGPAPTSGLEVWANLAHVFLADFRHISPLWAAACPASANIDQTSPASLATTCRNRPRTKSGGHVRATSNRLQWMTGLRRDDGEQ